jgi:hypothetical protein
MNTLSRKGLRIGVQGEYFPQSLKQELLLFDQIAVPDIEGVIGVSKVLGNHDHSFNQLVNDLEFCLDKGLVFAAGIDTDLETAIKLAKDDTNSWLHAVLVNRDLAEAKKRLTRSLDAKDIVQARKDTEQALATRIRFAQFLSRVTAQVLRSTQELDAAPIVQGDLVPPVIPDEVRRRANIVLGAGDHLHIKTQSTSDVLRIVLNKIPTPDDSVPWEQILEFRSSEEARGYLQGLRVWMTEFANQSLSSAEATEKLDWLLFERRKHLEAHKMSYNFTAFGAAFVASMELIENLGKFKWGKAAKGIVALAHRKAELMKLEMESPGKELNYLMLTQKEFGKKY